MAEIPKLFYVMSLFVLIFLVAVDIDGQSFLRVRVYFVRNLL